MDYLIKRNIPFGYIFPQFQVVVLLVTLSLRCLFMKSLIDNWTEYLY